MRELRTEITINAPPSTVWQILTDIDSYPAWNSFLRHVSGEMMAGGKLKICAYPPGGISFSFKPKVTRLVPDKELRWVGGLILPCVFVGEHIFELESSGAGTRLVQREKFNGFLVPLFWRSLNTHTRLGFEEMNLALKARAEESAR